jgi:hypothetical protein
VTYTPADSAGMTAILPGQTALIGQTRYTWTWTHDDDGRWADAPREYFASYFSLTVVCEMPRLVRLAYRADGLVRFWCNGALVHKQDTTVHSGRELQTEPIALGAGRNCLMLKLIGYYDLNSLEVRVTDTAGGPAAGLRYLREGPSRQQVRRDPLRHELRFGNLSAGTVTVIDALGRIVARVDRPALHARGRCLPPGIYFVRCGPPGSSLTPLAVGR